MQRRIENVTSELKGMGSEATGYNQALFRNLPGGTEQKHEGSVGTAFVRAGIEAVVSQSRQQEII
jgi:hypothetical protein